MGGDNPHLVWEQDPHSMISADRESRLPDNEHEIRARQERLAVLGRQALELAHEVRNPLASIRGFCQLLCGHVADEKGRRYLQVLVREVDRLNGLINDFVGLARPPAPRMVATDLNALVRETLALVDSRRLLCGIEIRQQLREIPAVPVDRDRIKQLLLNLVNNALEAMEHRDPPRVLTVTTAVADRFVQIRIEDTGCGIPEHILKRLGTPFLSTKTAGTGLGLLICRRLAAEHGGTISLKSREGQGTSVTVTLPLNPCDCR